jgi:hypothetical protein
MYILLEAMARSGSIKFLDLDSCFVSVQDIAALSNLDQLDLTNSRNGGFGNEAAAALAHALKPGGRLLRELLGM